MRSSDDWLKYRANQSAYNKLRRAREKYSAYDFVEIQSTSSSKITRFANILAAVHCSTPHNGGVSCEHAHTLARRHIPHTRRLVKTGRDDHIQCRAVHDAGYYRSVPVQLAQCAGGARIEHKQLTVFTAIKRVFVR